MDALKRRITTARKALKTLRKISGLARPNLVQRDAAIHRLKYSFEVVWKVVQHYLSDREGLAVGSPKGCIHASREVGLLNEEETVLALEMTDDRNLTSHTYNEAIAKRIYKNLERYTDLMEKWLSKIES